MIPKTPIPNMALTLLENCEHEELLDIFETCLKKRTIRSECVRLADAWRILFSDMHLFRAELVEEMQAADHKLGVARQRMLCEFIKADCAGGGRFYKSHNGRRGDRPGGTDHGRRPEGSCRCYSGRYTGDPPAGHFLRHESETDPDQESRTQLLSSVFDRNGMPGAVLIFGMGNISRFDLEAIAEVF